MVTEWERNEDVLAERFKREEIEGIFKKKFRSKEDENIVIEKHGEIYKELGSGEFTVSGLLDKDFTDLLIMDKSEKILNRTLKRVFLSDGKKMDINLEIKFKVFHSDKFSSNLVRNRKRLFIEDVWADILSNLIYKKSLPEIKKHDITEFLKEEFCEKTKDRVEKDMKKMFKDWGLVLTKFSIDFRIPEKEKAAPEKVEKPAVGETRIEEAKNEPEKMVEEAERRISASKEDTIAELEKERLERDVQMELEKKEAQRDAEEAMEALDLKELKDKRELLKKVEEKELGAGEKGEEGEDLEKELENLKKAKDITERKFYKKELSEEAFQRMMEDFEKRIIEIETRLKSKKD
jgi:hypothetical protein